MLKALELHGFKSFADKTRFDFPAGITVVVGPNGSGKSNVVDAIKWVLGEQSAKSLRGAEMADVIFKGSGSGTGGRKPMNTAEATIVIDNSEGKIPVDAPEVHVTRRVYRSGEGEYLINRRPCRLKDIKDLFRGTGAGTDAYSLIEQGKVDRLLQASAKERRAIFEEAAGISRFKSKKLEAQRRLERVDQNLLRLSDIVDEVDSRLRSVRSQASKARRYREYSERLQQLRTQVGMADWRQLSDKLAVIDEQITSLRHQIQTIATDSEYIEARSVELDVTIVETGEAIRDCDNRCAGNREQIAAHESTVAQQRARSDELLEEERRLRVQLHSMNNRAGDLQGRLADISSQLDSAESVYRSEQDRLAGKEDSLLQLAQQSDEIRARNETQRETYVEAMREAARLGNQVSAGESRLESVKATASRCQTRLDELAAEMLQVNDDLDTQQNRQAKIQAEHDERVVKLQDAQLRLGDMQRLLSASQEYLNQLQGRYGGASQRAQVLEDLEAKREGIGAGVKQVLARAGEESDSVFASQVKGVLADFVDADVELAAMVDVALGDAASYVVLDGGDVISQLSDGPVRLSGRVGFLQLEDPAPTGREEISRLPSFEGRPGVIGRADRMVDTMDEMKPLVSRLLRRTWFVDSLSVARSLRVGDKEGTRFVTRDGQLLDSDGAVVLGPRHTSTGLVSRRSELHVLQHEVSDLEQKIGRARNEIERQQMHIGQHQRDVDRLLGEMQEVENELAETALRVEGGKQRREQLARLEELARQELDAAMERRDAVQEELQSLQRQVAAVEQQIADLEHVISAAERELATIDREKQAKQIEATASKVELAKSEQRLESLRAQRAQFENDSRERSHAIQELHQRQLHCRSRREQTDLAILDATSYLAELYLLKERFAAETQLLADRREAVARERKDLAADLQRRRKELRGLEEELHQVELRAGELKHERSTLAERLLEDYGIDLAAASHELTDEEEHERQAVDEEIASLRRKISNIGAVNMDALEELDELEERHGLLDSQYRDLADAKQALERIINKINADSRRLFIETLEAIRANFQQLFRRAFGGGRADIVLEEDADVLECGIEIVANPPGKPQFSNSLLSGGEKALTAVSLLLAIFQFRPSPFCVLDEVDAPFDEANIGRFVDVLTDFLGWTKFVIVTHSKKTMTAATTLYGVTMQESGVSKRVSVQFDDVSEDGHIAETAVKRADDEAAADGDERGVA